MITLERKLAVTYTSSLCLRVMNPHHFCTLKGDLCNISLYIHILWVDCLVLIHAASIEKSFFFSVHPSVVDSHIKDVSDVTISLAFSFPNVIFFHKTLIKGRCEIKFYWLFFEKWNIFDYIPFVVSLRVQILHKLSS